MNILIYILTPAFYFVFFYCVFRPLERAFPANSRQKFFRSGWLTDLFFFLGGYWLWVALVYGLLTHFGRWLDDVMPAAFRTSVAAQPWWVQAIEVVLLSDFLIYWGHRLQHRVDFLWRFHSIHHTARHMDWLAAHREHPVDTIYTIGLINLPALILGFPLSTLAPLILFRGIWAIYIHSNVRIPHGPLRLLIGAPELHHWHHDRERDAGNYANLSPLMDMLFGTHVCPDYEPRYFGINERAAHNYIGHLLQPFKKRNPNIAAKSSPATQAPALFTPHAISGTRLTQAHDLRTLAN